MSIVDFSKFVVLPIASLVKADWNYKEEDPELTAKLVENIKRNGQIENILVRELDTGFYEISNGNHRYDAMVEVGATEVVVYNLGRITLAEAQRICIETNETRFQTNTSKLSGILAELSTKWSVENLAHSMPYNQERLNELIEMSTFDWSKYGQPKPTDLPAEGQGGTETIHITVDSADAPRWREWCERMRKLTSASDGDALMIATRLAQELSDQDIESAMAS